MNHRPGKLNDDGDASIMLMDNVDLRRFTLPRFSILGTVIG